MSHKQPLCMDSRIQNYIENLYLNTSSSEYKEFQNLNETARSVSLPSIEISHIERKMLQFFIALHKPKKVLEFGTLVGMSTVAILKKMTLSPESLLVTCEANTRAILVAKENLKNYSHLCEIKILEGEIFKNIEAIKQHAPFDLVFLDADKLNYHKYFHLAKSVLRPGGLLLADNTLSQGLVVLNKIDLPDLRNQVAAIQEFNKLLAQDSDFNSFLFPTGEGFSGGVLK
jgi:predicted O-methyltransferase YrrM